MVSSNNVTITEHENGDLTVTCFDGVPPWHELDAVEAAAVEAHYRAKFAAERMPEDVADLLDVLADALRSEAAISDRPGQMERLEAIADRLEAAYSQKGKAHEGA